MIGFRGCRVIRVGWRDEGSGVLAVGYFQPKNHATFGKGGEGGAF